MGKIKFQERVNMYQNKTRQREANKLAQARFKAKKQGIVNNQVIPAEINAPQSNIGVVLGNTLPVIPSEVIPLVIPDSNTLTIDDIIKMPLAQAKALLRSWATGTGSAYQSVLGNLAIDYDVVNHHYPITHLISRQV